MAIARANSGKTLVLLENLVSQLFSALGTASAENFAAVCIGHSFAETMLLFAVTFFGLICPFHKKTPIL